MVVGGILKSVLRRGTQAEYCLSFPQYNRFLVQTHLKVLLIERGGSGPSCIIENLLDSPIPVNTYNRNGSTTLCAAAEGGFLRASRLLLDLGAEIAPTEPDFLNYTARLNLLRQLYNGFQLEPSLDPVFAT